MEGYFQADRSIAKALLPRMGTKFTDAEAYLYLSSFAAYAPREIMTNSKLISLNVGELVASERYLEQAWTWSRKKVRNFKQILKDKGLLNQRVDQQETVLILHFIRESAPQGTAKYTSKGTKVEPERNQGGTEIIIKNKENRRESYAPAPASQDCSISSAGEPLPNSGQIMQMLMKRVNGLRPEWGRPATWTHMEQSNLMGGAAQQLMELTDEDWQGLAAYLRAPLASEKAFFQPRNRNKFCEAFSDVFAAYQRWLEKKPGGRTPAYQSSTSAHDLF